MSVQAQTALLARVTGRPVKLTLSREESIRLHPKRHPIRMEYAVGCDADGRLTAVKARMIGDSGAYASVGAKVLERAAGHACGPYRVREHRHRVDRRLHQQPAVRRDARVRRQPGALRHGRVHRPAGEEGRARPLGDPLAQRPRGRRRVLHRAGAREVGRHQEDAGGRQAALRPGAGRGPRRRHRVRPEEQRHRQRREGVGQGAAGRRAGPDGVDLQRLHRDGPGAAHGARAVRGRGDGPACRLLPSEGGHHLPAGVRPDDRLAGDAARRPRRRERGGEAPRRPRRRPSPVGSRRPRLRRRRARRRHDRAGRGRAEGQDAHGVRLRHAAVHPGRARAAWRASSPRTTSAAR